MSSSDRITQSKGKPAELNLPTRTRPRRKSPSREAKQEMEQPTGFVEGLDQLQQEPRPDSSQSITGSITGERPHSRALSVTVTDGR